MIWHGGLTRQEAMTIAASCDIGLGWLHEDLDASLELSTKILEFGSMGLPVILNRSLAHEDLLGADYPLYARDVREAADAVELAAGDPGVFQAAARCHDVRGRAVQPGTRRCADSADTWIRPFPAPLAGTRPQASADAAAPGHCPVHGDAGTVEGSPRRARCASWSPVMT